MRLAVHAGDRFGRGCLGEAVDFARFLIHPVRLEVDAELAFGGQVLLMGRRYGLRGHVAAAELVNVQEELVVCRLGLVATGGSGPDESAQSQAGDTHGFLAFFSDDGEVGERLRPVSTVPDAARPGTWG